MRESRRKPGAPSWTRRFIPEAALVGLGDPAPIRRDGTAPVVVAIHGFGGTPLDVGVVVEAAQQLGLAAEAPLLAGHGTRPAHLAETRYEDWYASVARTVESIDRRPLLLAGLSMGSVIALDFAARHPDQVCGVALLGNALWLRSPFPGFALRAAGWLRLPDFNLPKYQSDISDPRARQEQLTYNVQPVHSALSLQRAADRVSADLAAVSCPALLIHGALDRTCPVSNAWRAAARLGSSDTRVVVLPRSAHVLTRDYERDALRAELIAFFERRATALSAPSVSS